MRLEAIIAVMNVTVLMVAVLMVALVILPLGRDVVGHKRNWVWLMSLCVLLAVRAVLEFTEPAWIEGVRSLLGIGVAILFPWILWKRYRDIRHGAESEKTG
ncbi:MAG TPA: hypothetical protein VLY20_01155 [Nitrospiria bacterium]|nr:hypothetical protein [Nitrospiria bacterium]